MPQMILRPVLVIMSCSLQVEEIIVKVVNNDKTVFIQMTRDEFESMVGQLSDAADVVERHGGQYLDAFCDDHWEERSVVKYNLNSFFDFVEYVEYIQGELDVERS